jgi:hypothetical protein
MPWKKLTTGDKWQQAASSVSNCAGTGLLARKILRRPKELLTQSTASPVAVYMLYYLHRVV